MREKCENLSKELDHAKYLDIATDANEVLAQVEKNQLIIDSLADKARKIKLYEETLDMATRTKFENLEVVK